MIDRTRPTVVVATARNRYRIELPPRVFAAVTECVRFDALRHGLLTSRQWGEIRATVKPSFFGDNDASRSFAFVVAVETKPKPACKRFGPNDVQGLGLYVESQLARAEAVPSHTVPHDRAARFDLSGIGEVALYWDHAHGPMPVSLAPYVLPDTFVNPPTVGQGAEPPEVVLSDSARHDIRNLAQASVLNHREMGGCLLGVLSDPATLRVDRVAVAPLTGGTRDEFVFDQRFWSDVARNGTNRGHRCVGWIHTHLVDFGHPSTLSARDLRTAHMHFRAPWTLTALVCASASQSHVRWFHWIDGALRESGPRIHLTPHAEVNEEKGSYD